MVDISCTTIDDFITTFDAIAKEFKEWKNWGITLRTLMALSI